MKNDLETQAKLYQAQRKAIDTLLKGLSGDDFARMIGQVSESLKEVRAVVAAEFTDDGATIVPDGRNLNSIGTIGRQRRYGGAVHAKLKTLMEASGEYLIPETQIDALPAVIKEMAEDKNALNHNERTALKNIPDKLQDAKSQLEAAVLANKQDPSGYISSSMAARAKAALLVIEEQLIPKLEPMYPKLIEFDENFVTRHGNGIYRDFLKGMEGKKSKPGISSGMKKFAATLALGAGLGVTGDEIIRHYVTRPEGTGTRDVRSDDPEHGKGDYRSKEAERAAKEQAPTSPALP